jgi:hypothetical protein
MEKVLQELEKWVQSENFIEYAGEVTGSGITPRAITTRRGTELIIRLV